jgi:excisionase family DNA binding protein
MDRKLLTVEAAAEILSMKPKSLSRFCLLGKVKAVKVGRQWRISSGEIDRIMKEGIDS